MRGRKKKDLPPAKERFVGLRFTEEQYSVLEHNAKAAQLSVSEYIRRSIIHDEHEILEELRKINKVGSNLNQIARHLNQGGVMTNPLAAELKGIARMLHDTCMKYDAAVEKEYGNC